MSHEGPKLYAHKPKKAQLKQSRQQKMPEAEWSTTSAPSSGLLAMDLDDGGRGRSATPKAPRESFIRRYKFVWPLLLGVNFVVGAYLFTRTKKKDVPVVLAVEEQASTLHHDPSLPKEPVKLLDPIPENQQRELFKWMLEEKRKIIPKDAEEKKRIEEEKSYLKHYIRAKSVPTI